MNQNERIFLALLLAAFIGLALLLLGISQRIARSPYNFAAAEVRRAMMDTRGDTRGAIGGGNSLSSAIGVHGHSDHKGDKSAAVQSSDAPARPALETLYAARSRNAVAEYTLPADSCAIAGGSSAMNESPSRRANAGSKPS